MKTRRSILSGKTWLDNLRDEAEATVSAALRNNASASTIAAEVVGLALERAAEYRAVLAQAPNKDRRAAALRLYQSGLTFKEVGRHMDISPPSAARLVHLACRARGLLGHARWRAPQIDEIEQDYWGDKFVIAFARGASVVLEGR